MGHGSMSYQLKTVRLIMVLVNVILFLIGATLLGEGIDLLISGRFHNFTEFISNVQSSNNTKNNVVSDEILYIIMIIPGFTLLSIGFFGCSGAITQIHCLLFFYSFIVVINLMLQMMIIICSIVFPSKIKEKFISIIRVLIRDKYKGPLEKNLQLTSYLWDLIMYQLKCCGIESKNDFDITNNWNRTNPWWTNSMSIENKNFKYPLTCCPINNISNKDWQLSQEAISCALHGNNIYAIGCYKKLLDILHSSQTTIFIVILLIIMIEMAALIFVLVIYNRNQMNRLHHIMEGLPPPYPTRTRMNNANLYFQI
ncbi:unnamed protein product [Rotaria sp. Silwood2]|nr:unnamed protein product [Rotaria sp. Silwood2]CAF2643971.1 unnamed protein product [Rotaria sp. Silwood2]CAF2902999.1 unnamed protein product [Rotaria sp. Silwood2]CAF3896978.1 unnamed protein product [Rotaria sp. Silwood2]CAF3938042.1 unnamed protein product [Rotaria sp. Silwood2]